MDGWLHKFAYYLNINLFIIVENLNAASLLMKLHAASSLSRHACHKRWHAAADSCLLPPNHELMRTHILKLPVALPPVMQHLFLGTTA